jgi:hypothetical protein
MSDAECLYEQARLLANTIIDLCEEAECDPPALVQACIWVLGCLLKRAVPPDMKRAVHAKVADGLWRQMEPPKTVKTPPMH